MAEKAVKIWFQNRRQKEKNRATLSDTTNYSHSSSDSSGSPSSLPHTPGSMETDSGSDDDNETDDGVYTPSKRDSVPRVTVVGTDETVLEAAMILCFMKSSV